jgi:FkbM family methyltransferase
MPLSLRERLTQTLMPAALYYRSRIADEASWGEHELDVLPEIMAPGGTAIDAGANQGVFAYAFSRIAAEVEAFEPNPDYARFAQRMLGTRARVHQLALSDKPGHAQFVVPLADDGTELHLGGMLSNGDAATEGKSLRFDVELRTIDSFAFKDVRAIKIDVEGSELAVLAGGRETILRDRPPLIVELLTGAYADPAAATQTICDTYDYAAWLVTQEGERIEALPVIRSLGSNTTWGSTIRNRNVLFLRRD